MMQYLETVVAWDLHHCETGLQKLRSLPEINKRVIRKTHFRRQTSPRKTTISKLYTDHFSALSSPRLKDIPCPGSACRIHHFQPGDLELIKTWKEDKPDQAGKALIKCSWSLRQLCALLKGCTHYTRVKGPIKETSKGRKGPMSSL